MSLTGRLSRIYRTSLPPRYRDAFLRASPRRRLVVNAASMTKEPREILVIDDEPSVADALKLILEDDGYRVVIAHTGREGIEHARRTEFSLTITDLRLPDMTGLDVLAALCRPDSPRRVILITSHGTPEVFRAAADCGAVGVLPKPFQPSDILQLIADTLASH